MNISDFLSMLVGVLLGGLGAAMVNIIYANRKQSKDYKMKILSDILGYRGQLINDYGKEFQVACNQIILAFQDNEKVIKLFLEFKEKAEAPHESVGAQNHRNEAVTNALISLLKAMCDDLKINYNFANDDLFTKPMLINNEQVAHAVFKLAQQSAKL